MKYENIYIKLLQESNHFLLSRLNSMLLNFAIGKDKLWFITFCLNSKYSFIFIPFFFKKLDFSEIIVYLY